MGRIVIAVAWISVTATCLGVARGHQPTKYVNADLPPLLEFLDGSPVRNMEDWQRRREEIRLLMSETFIGNYPKEVPTVIKEEILQEQREPDGSTRRNVRLTFGTPHKVSFEMWVWIPKGKGPFPILLTAPRYYQIGWAKMALARGYMVGLYPGVDFMHHEEDYPDYENVWKEFRAEYPDATWTEISCKGWLGSRALDYLLDPKYGYKAAKGQVAIIGWSRYGKQSIIAAAHDERITCVVARSSGTPASAPYRFASHSHGGETPNGFPEDWFLQSLRNYSGRENEMPIDSHGWYALIAPRPLLLHLAYNDGASDFTFSNERAYLEGKKVYAMLGKPENLYLDYRPGGHGPLTDEHRKRNLDWMDLCFDRGAATREQFPEPALIHQFDWDRWKAAQKPDDLEEPAATEDIRAKIRWVLGEKPDKIPHSGEKGFLTRKEVVARFGEDILPDRWPSPNTARIPVLFGEGIRGNLYYNTTIKSPMPVVIYLHSYNWAVGYRADYDAVIPWGRYQPRTPYHYVAANGYAVLTFDQIGFGTRVLEDRDFYEKFPRWSKLGRMIHDVRRAIDFVVDGRGRAERELPKLKSDEIYLSGYSLGGMLALHTAALDDRVTDVACFSGFTPMRTDSDENRTGGLRRFWEWHALMPKLGLFHGREDEVPYDYDDLLRLIAPRPCLIVSQRRDRHAHFDDVSACVRGACEAWRIKGKEKSLVYLTPDDFSHFQHEQHDMFLRWLKPPPPSSKTGRSGTSRERIQPCDFRTMADEPGR